MQRSVGQLDTQPMNSANRWHLRKDGDGEDPDLRFMSLNQRNPGADRRRAVCDAGITSLSKTERGDDRAMPEPKNFERRSSAPARIKEDELLLRSQFIGEEESVPSQPVLKTSLMSKSLPIMYGSRANHNRGVGFTLLSPITEGGRREQSDRGARVAEFDDLLAGL